MNQDQTKLLLRYKDRSVFRHSILAKYVIYDLENGNSIDIANKTELWLCIWSPKSDSIAYVRNDNNVYYYDLNTNVESKLTTDGLVENESGVIYNGIADWVYEEEVFSSVNGLWFSPNGTYLAMIHLDDTHVQKFTYPLYGEPGDLEHQYPSGITLRYPKSGTKNPTVELRVVNTEDLTAKYKVIPVPNQIGDEPILGSVTWINDLYLAPMWLNRRQNKVEIDRCNAATVFCLTVS